MFRREARRTSRTRLSAREARAATQASTPNRYAYVSWRALNVKKAREYLSCWLRTDKVFVYFTNLKMRDLKSAKKFEDAPRRDDRDTGHRFTRYAQDHVVFVQPPCLIQFRLGGFLFENENRDVAATQVPGAEDTPGPPQNVATRFVSSRRSGLGRRVDRWLKRCTCEEMQQFS